MLSVCVIHIVLITTLRDGDSYTQDPGEKAESQKRFVPNPRVRAHEKRGQALTSGSRAWAVSHFVLVTSTSPA